MVFHDATRRTRTACKISTFFEDLDFLNPRTHLKWSPIVKKYKYINKHCAGYVSWIFLTGTFIQIHKLVSDYNALCSLKAIEPIALNPSLCSIAIILKFILVDTELVLSLISIAFF